MNIEHLNNRKKNGRTGDLSRFFWQTVHARVRTEDSARAIHHTRLSGAFRRSYPVHSTGSWSFYIRGFDSIPVTWSWEEFMALPSKKYTVDIHCVTKWTKLGTE